MNRLSINHLYQIKGVYHLPEINNNSLTYLQKKIQIYLMLQRLIQREGRMQKVMNPNLNMFDQQYLNLERVETILKTRILTHSQIGKGLTIPTNQLSLLNSRKKYLLERSFQLWARILNLAQISTNLILLSQEISLQKRLQ